MPKQTSIEDALDHCLLNPGNLSVNELLDKFPEYREQIKLLLPLAASLNAIQTPLVPAERRAAFKERLMAATERSDAAHQSAKPVPVASPSPSQPANPGLAAES